MHEKTRETLADINRIERERRKHLVDCVVQYIGREFHRQFPQSTLTIIFHPLSEDVCIDGTLRDTTDSECEFINEYLRDAREITDDYTRVLPDDLIVEPGTNKSEVAATALDNLDVELGQQPRAEATDILLAYMTLIGQTRVVDAYLRVADRITQSI